MHIITAVNVQDALCKGLSYLNAFGRPRASRNGEVLVAPEPVITKYLNPRHRVLFWAAREANPFFHLFEALWMLNGNRDVDSVAHYVRRMRNFSDDGDTFHGAYGYRWLRHFGIDQLIRIVDRLRHDPTDRRCVLQIWDACADLGAQSKDLPCNTQVYFRVTPSGELDMTVTCRSNDIIWGAYGANAVHFSVLHEFMATCIGLPIGYYYQFSNDYHVYVSVFESLREKYQANPGAARLNFYASCRDDLTFPLMQVPLHVWRGDLRLFIEGHYDHFDDPFFSSVARPMALAYDHYRLGQLEQALEIADQVMAKDWRTAACDWLLRRLNKRKEK